MQKNKIVLAVTAVVVLALLFAGVGYAFSGSARTYNQGDEQTLAYMSVTPADFKPIFTGDTPFDTYVYQGATVNDKLTAYAFKETPETVTVNEVEYTAIGLGSKNMTVLNNTGEDLTALTFNVTATSAIGKPDFVYIFELETTVDVYQVTVAWIEGTTTYYTYENDAFVAHDGINGADAFAALEGTKYINGPSVAYLVYDSSSATKSANLAGVILDGGNEVVSVNVYIAYIPNVYVPDNYIGPAEAKYIQATEYDGGVTYYADANGTALDSQPANAGEFDEGTFYQMTANTLPYIQTANAPADLSTTSFGIEVVDGSA